jgi:hypothetical protein
MLIGISVFGVLAARVAAFFVEANEAEASEDDQTGKKLDEILARLDRLERELQRRPRLEMNRPDADTAAPGPG